MSDVHFTFMEPKQKPGHGISLKEAWQVQLQKLLSKQDQTRFSIVEGTLDMLEPPHSLFDCVVSPANSYGIMDGGLVPPGRILCQVVLLNCAWATMMY